jgi:hypothetical protein
MVEKVTGSVMRKVAENVDLKRGLDIGVQRPIGSCRRSHFGRRMAESIGVPRAGEVTGVKRRK